MAEKIGYNDGILGLVGWVRKISLGTVKFRPVADRPANHSQWSWLENLERTLRILKDAHDAAIHDIPPPPPPPPPLPPPTAIRVAPRVANKVLPNGSDARYCCVNQPGVVWDSGTNRYRDDVASYDADGLCWGGRSPDLQVPGLTMANDINGRPYCSLPTVGDPANNSGSWAV